MVIYFPGRKSQFLAQVTVSEAGNICRLIDGGGWRYPWGCKEVLGKADGRDHVFKGHAGLMPTAT